MTGRRLIDDYMARLARELTLPRRLRARVLAEAEDHLLCAVADLVCDGRSAVDAEREALARHGSVAEVARSHARARSTRATVRTTTGVIGSVGLFGALFVATTQVPAVQAGIPATAVTTGAAGVVGWIAVQLALFCGALAVIRCHRLRGRSAGRAGALRLANRSAATAVAAIAVSLLLDIAAFVRMPAGQGEHAALVFGLVVLSLASSAGTFVQIAVAQRRLRALERHGPEPADEDALDDVRDALLAIARVLAGVPFIRRAAPLAELVVGRALASGSPVARVLRDHPWRFGATVALLAGLLASGGHLAAEGPPANVALALLVVSIIAAIEGSAVFACYVLFGRFLGLRGVSRACAAR